MKTLVAALLAALLILSESANAKTKLRPFTEKKLANGLTVLLMEDRALPYFSLTMLLKTGHSADPTDLKGVSYFTSNLLEKGTKKRKATVIANELGAIGSAFRVSTEPDAVVFESNTLSNHANELLDIFSDLITSPVFSHDEIERHRKETLANQQQLLDHPQSFASVAYAKIIYGDHPYAYPSFGTVESVKKINKAAITRHYLKYYRPSNAILAVVGRVDADIWEKLEKHFGSWVNRSVPAQVLGEPIKSDKQRIVLVHKADLTQAQIRIGQIGIPRKHPDYTALRFGNVTLGGGFTSRLMDQIRDNLGLTYGINSSVNAKASKGTFDISTFTRNEKVGEAVKKTIDIISSFVKDGLTADELKSTKGLVVGQFPRALEKAEDLAESLLRLRLYEVPDTFLTDYTDNVESLSRSDVTDAFKRNLDPSKLTIVVFANKAEVQGQLEALGSVEVIDYQKLMSQGK